MKEKINAQLTDKFVSVPYRALFFDGLSNSDALLYGYLNGFAKALGKEIGVSDAAIINWENGVHDIKGEYLIRLAKFFDVTTDYLLGLEN